MRICFILAILLILSSPTLALKEKNLKISVDTSYTANERAAGSISSDRNLEGNTSIVYLLDEKSRIDFRGKLSVQQILSDQTQNHDLGITYSSLIAGANKLGIELGLRPFTDLTTTTNTNTETRLALNYAAPLDKTSNLTFKSNYKNQAWINQSTQNYNLSQLILNYQKRLSSTHDFAVDAGYSLQNANTATNVFSEIQGKANYNQLLSKEQKLGLRYSFVGRNYSSGGTSSNSKHDLNVNSNFGKVDFGLNLVSNQTPASPASGYNGIGIMGSYTQPASEAAKWNIKSSFTYRDSSGATSSYGKINVQTTYDHKLSERQAIQVSNLLENSSYRAASSSYLHDLLGIKYENSLGDSSALSVGERFTIDNYPSAATKNATRHQMDLAYTLKIFKNIAVASSVGYEIKSYSNPSATQSDYSAMTLSVSLDNKFSPVPNWVGKASLLFSTFNKTNAQNASADTRDTNLSLRVAYDF